MAEIYFRPEDLSTAEVRKVLDFLNSAQSAQEIGDVIEIPDERDVGRKVGQRILDHRAKLGGAFADLQQLMDVPYVGPERFTEIVTVITGRAPGSPTADAYQTRVLAELYALRRLVAKLRADPKTAYQVTLRADRSEIFAGEVFVGQPVTITVQVTDRLSGQPVPNMRLTLNSSWGDLLAFVGFEKQQGGTITVYTDLNGIAEAEHSAPFVRDLTPTQQFALQTALNSLDPAADSPSKAMSGLQAMVRRYHTRSEADLRAAVDVYFSRRQEELTTALGAGVSLAVWEYCTGLITVYLHDDAQSTGVDVSAALNVRFKDWLKPWYVAFMDMSQSAATLDADIDNLSADNPDAAALLDGILNHVYAFVGTQPGRVGEFAGQKIARKAVNHFMAGGFADMELKDQQSLYPTLSIAAGSIGAETMGTLAVTTRIRKDAGLEMDGKLAPLGDVGQLVSTIDSVKGQLDDFQADYSRFEENYTTFETNYQTFDTHYGLFTDDYNQFTVNFQDFQTNYGLFSDNYTVFQGNYTDFATNISRFDKTYSTFTKTYTDFESKVGTFAGQFQTFKTDYAKFRTDFDRIG